MHGIYADASFDVPDLDTRSQWIGRGKQYLSDGIELRMMIDLCTTLYAHGEKNPYLIEKCWSRGKVE